MEIQGSPIRLPFLSGGDSINKREKEAQQIFLNNEKAVLKKLEENYEDALSEINEKIAMLLGRADADQQHVVYQVEFQKSLKAQVSAILETLHTNEFETISEYLTKSYEDGFITTMYNLQGQGIPLIFPLDQEQIINAIQHETNLSEDLYTSLGKDTKDLSKKIAGEISRGISGGQMYSEISRNISNWARIPKNNAMRITRTEMHRIQTKASMDACIKAKSKGADIVRQWDASLDKRTRDSHAQVDGEIRELDEKFSNGLMYPGDPNGRPEEVINCRCALLQRARWAVGNDFTKAVKGDDGDELAIIEADKYDDFKKQYQEASERVRQGAQKMNDPYQRNRSGKRVIRESKIKEVQNDIQNASSLEDINDIASKKFGFEVEFTKGSVEYAKEQVGWYEKLYNKYRQGIEVRQLDTKGMFASRAAAETFISPDYRYATISLSGKSEKPSKLDRLHSYTVKVDDANVNISGLTHEFAHTITASRGGDEDFWKEIKSLKNRYNRALTKIEKENIVEHTLSYDEAIRRRSEIFISEYANESVDEFMAEAFSDALLSSNPSPYSTQVLELVDRYFKKEPLENIGGSGTIKANKTISGHSNTPKKAEANDVIDHILDDGTVDARGFYGEDGMKQRDIHTTDHGNPRHHNYGEHGEHGHDYEWNDDGSLKNKTTRELSQDERKENGDIL